MKICPNCQTQYTDDTLRFCLQDGAPLEISQATRQPTFSMSGDEMQTVARRVDEDVTRVREQSEATRVSTSTEKSGGSNLAVAIGALAGVLLLLAGAAAIGIWLYLRDPAIPSSNNSQNTNPGNLNSSITPTPTGKAPTPSPTQTPATNSGSPAIATPTPDVDKGAASRDISRQINAWKSHAESGNLDSQMQTYAPTVDYYRRRGASREFVRADRARAYRLFDSMSITVSDVSVSVDDSGATATAVFDKEWVFDGARRSTGKVRQQLQFRKINGQWLITGERDLKVYYTN